MNSVRRTVVIGRHLVDVPADARVIPSWSYNKIEFTPLPHIKSELDFRNLLDKREAFLKSQPQRKHGSMFIERLPMAQGSVALLSWSQPDSEFTFSSDVYFRVDTRFIQYSSRKNSPAKRQVAVDFFSSMAKEWIKIDATAIPVGVGFVAGEMMLVNDQFNLESWRLSIELAGKPDVSFVLTGFATGKPDVGLRDRAGGALAGMLGAVSGLQQLRNRRRPVGPIEADEILVAATQDGKRAYGFKWEAPGKARSLSEPNLNATLRVEESAYLTNKESFATDEEALAVWDDVIDSIRLRPGAVA